jgi:CBS domain-containing protein
MTTARDIMTEGTECVGTGDTLVDAARKMRDLDVGGLPICGDDGKLAGMITDRDIVVRCLADGGDPSTSPPARWDSTRSSRSAPTTTSTRCCGP